jgi:general secretion pathway protein G
VRTGSTKQNSPRRQPIGGFTLIELLVVFTLMALLLSIAAPRYLATVDNSRDKVRQQNLATLRDALDKFKADQGRYPSELAELVAKQYLRALPVDPVSGTQAWVPLQHPTGMEQGVYDVAPPQPAGQPEQTN